MPAIRNVLFICTGNSARSILAEATLNARSGGRLQAFSAGSHPTGRVNPLALATLADAGIPIGNLSSKSWEAFAARGAPPIHLAITVCDSAAGETCPLWPGAPLKAHWGVEDPAAVQGDEQTRRDAFRVAHARLARRIDALLALPAADLEPRVLEPRLQAIGRQD